MDKSKGDMGSDPVNSQLGENVPEEAVKWDYTDRKQTLYTGAAVVGLNILLIIIVIMDRTIPAVHAFFSGK